jgi:UDP-N-acetylmuramoylalanine--D-glutamate ligase
MGLGTRGGGSGVARYLAELGSMVTVTDLRHAVDLREQVCQLDGLGIRFALGGHDPDDFAAADVVVRNPGVRKDDRFLQIAREAGATVEMEMSIFLRACPAPVIGITGTKGKTSTSALCGEMLHAFRADTVMAGNMGVSAVGQLAKITLDTPVVLELSSWQLEGMDERGIGPEVAVITNIAADHLDTYADFADYAETKRSIGRHLGSDDVLILNADDTEVARAAKTSQAEVLWFGVGPMPGPGIRVDGQCLASSVPGREGMIELSASDHYRGEHQRRNAAAAAVAALRRGASLEQVAIGLQRFRGVPNRMELVATIEGVEFVNDTAATAPVAAIASLRSLEGRRIHLIGGGADKRLPLDELAEAISGLAASAVLLDGSATPMLRDLIEANGRLQVGEIACDMVSAVKRATGEANRGDIVLLSPGCASFGLFRDEFDRGDQFREAVRLLLSESRP